MQAIITEMLPSRGAAWAKPVEMHGVLAGPGGCPTKPIDADPCYPSELPDPPAPASYSR